MGRFSIYARVFGRGLRLPEGAVGEEDLPSMDAASALARDTSIARSFYLRQMARRAFVEVDTQARWKRAPTHTAEQDLRGGRARLLLWPRGGQRPRTTMARPLRDRPARPPSAVWCPYRGSILKASPKNLRLETPEKHAGEDLPMAAKGPILDTAPLRTTKEYYDFTGSCPPVEDPPRAGGASPRPTADEAPNPAIPARTSLPPLVEQTQGGSAAPTTSQDHVDVATCPAQSACMVPNEGAALPTLEATTRPLGDPSNLPQHRLHGRRLLRAPRWPTVGRGTRRRGVPGLPPRALIKLKKAAYGLVDSP